MNWTVIIETIITLVLGGTGWAIRRAWLKYERALAAAERERTRAAEKELFHLKEIVAGLHGAVAVMTRDQNALQAWLVKWAETFVSNFSSTLKGSQQNADQLRNVLVELTSYLGGLKPKEESAVKEIAKDTFRVQTKKIEGK